MVDIGLLDTLVKLASFGTSGISIFAIFWIGWLLYRRADSRSPEEHKTLRYFMGMCLIIAIISAAAGIVNAVFDANTIGELEAVNQNLAEELNTKSAEIVGLGTEISQIKEALNALQPPIKILAHPSSNVKPNGAVCLTLTWLRNQGTDDIRYIWTADDGIFDPPEMTTLTRAKWTAPEDTPATTIKINVVAVNANTQEYIGEGEATNIGIIGLSTPGQPGRPSVSCQ